jgi:hypothetical protein
MTTGSSNRQSLYSQQWTVTSVNDAYNLDEDEDDDQDVNNGSIFLAKDLWRLRSVNRIREAVKDKQRRMVRQQIRTSCFLDSFAHPFILFYLALFFETCLER